MGVLVATLGCVPAAALAQSTPMMVQRTPSYSLVLHIGPAEHMVMPMDAMHGQAGEVMVNSGTMSHDAAMMAAEMDQGMAANHHIGVHIALGDSSTVVTDVMPSIRITDKSTGVTRDLTALMGLYDSAMGAAAFHYGQNMFLADGTYLITVEVSPDETAQFRDVVVTASPMMMADHPMGADMTMSLPEGTARDGRMFSQESAVTQSLFRLVWGDKAAMEWVTQRNASLPH
jgi:hypothetical protein